MENKKLEFSMKIDIPTILLLIAMSVGGFMYITGIERSVALNTQSIAENASEIIEVKQNSKEVLNLVLARLDRMDAKFDKKFDQIINIIHSYQTRE